MTLRHRGERRVPLTDFKLEESGQPEQLVHLVSGPDNLWDVRLTSAFRGVCGTLSEVKDNVWRLQANQVLENDYVLGCRVMDVDIILEFSKSMCGALLLECRWCSAKFDVRRDDKVFFQHVKTNHMVAVSFPLSLAKRMVDLEYVDQTCWMADRVLRPLENWSTVPKIVVTNSEGKIFIVCPYCKCVSRDSNFDMVHHYLSHHVSFCGNICDEARTFSNIRF